MPPQKEWIRFEGGKELEANIRALGRELGRAAVLAALKETAKPLEDAMKRNAPQASGEAVATIHTASVDVKGHAQTVAVGPDKDHFYLQFPEWGTSRQPAKPWARPAWDEVSSGLLKILGGKLWGQIARKARTLAARQAKAA